MGLLSLIQEQFIKQAVEYLAKDPKKNIETILNWAQTIAVHDSHKEYLADSRIHLLDTKSNWHKLALKILTDISTNTRKTLAVNLISHAFLSGVPLQNKNAKKHGFSIPWSLLIDPTERCNLKCKGCWASDYEKEADLELATLERIISEATELGIYFITLSGGEPLTRKNELLYLARKFSDSVFLVFTNGTLIDQSFAQSAALAGNILFALSLEGFEKATDERRGLGVYNRVIQAMEILKKEGLMFGFSTTYTRNNVTEVGSDEFIDLMVEKGCYFGWYFTYVPVGGGADLEYMATPAQRAGMFERIKYFRTTKPIFVADFWNDGETSKGCIAGGRFFIHINAKGEVEPCAFVHYSTCNIKDHSLLEALGSPLMRAYQQKQPFNENHLRPCPLIDNPQLLADMVAETGAKSTQLHNSGGAQLLADSLQSYAAEWQQIADEIKNK